jgi:hypothetical protein
LSVAAFHESPIELCPTLVITNPVGVEGATESTKHAEVVKAMLEVADTLPAASTAATPSVYDIPHDTQQKT